MPNPVEELITGNAWKLVALYVLVCGFAPVMEETMFRGALFHHLRRRWGWLGSASVVAVIFAIIHP
jgi:membrane protease YdiL (CAAX protease family)